MTAPDSILQLVELFETHQQTYRSQNYPETQARLEFINPFFEALGWDVLNKQGYAHAYKDVIHEDQIKVAGASKAPDYAFRIGGTRKFFVEAKKPAVNLKDEISPAYQLRRYAWSAKLPLSILTDFEEFAVYDCREKPNLSDKASQGRTLLLNYKEYPERWDEIAGIFAREAVLKGSFDKYAESNRGRHGTTEVDDAFLTEIERWRELLARNIALRNPGISQRALNYSVQMTIDRLVFLRICEDRGIEFYGTLQNLLNNGDIYSQLVLLYMQADYRYNSGLFHFKDEKDQSDTPDMFTLGLSIDDKVLKDIFDSLYYPKSPYEFSVLPADILGQVYERFLGKVIRLTAGHHAVVEDKPEVKKAGGVFYTPTFIVEYIVKHTLGKLLEGRKPGDVSVGRGAALRVLDPACGSGSFLIGAYQYLLDWYRDGYSAEAEKWTKGKQPPLVQAQGGGYRLTTAERKRILLDHIFGVDIDTQAVEVTKLSLLLKVLEGESEETLGKQLSLFHERALPNLGNNIKCGNSLIGPDFYAGQQSSFLDVEEQFRINAFDWHKEFAPVFASSGGFDVVIGNPPYSLVTIEENKNYYEMMYETTEGRFDTFELFIEKGIKLCKPGGLFSYIIPSPFLSNLYTRKLRRFIREKYRIEEITNFGMDVFADPTVHTCIIVIKNSKNEKANKVKVRKKVLNPLELQQEYDYEIEQHDIGVNQNCTFDIFIDPIHNTLINKISENSQSLSDFCYIRQCIKTGDDKKYVKCFDLNTKIDKEWKPTLRGRSINRYSTLVKNEYVKYGPWLARNWQNKSFYETPKIVVRETGSRITATLDLENRYLLSSLYSIYPKNEFENLSLNYILGIINSKIATYVARLIALELTTGAFTKFRTNQLGRLPIYNINFSNSSDVQSYDQIVSLVERMLALHQQLATANTPNEKAMLQRQIESTDAQIDSLVYRLYGLTEEEIRVVEGVQRILGTNFTN